MSVTTLFRRSETDFWATVKSAFPADSTSAAELFKLSVNTLSVTTAITAMATARAVSAVLTRRVPRLCTMSPTKDNPALFPFAPIWGVGSRTFSCTLLLR